MKTSVVIVTFNKKYDLVRAIDSLSNQTKRFEEIIIVDNNSSDGTKNLLLEKKLVHENSDRNVILNGSRFTIHYKNSGSNIGGAGGFALGQKIALDRGADFIWFTDDDAICKPDTLEKLFSAMNNTGCQIVNPLVIDIENKDKLSFGLSRDIQTVEKAHVNKDQNGMIFDLANPFNGTLFSSDTVNKIGFVKAEMFIWGDEAEYLKRAKYHGLKFATVVDAEVYHPKSQTSFDSFLFGLFKMEVKPDKLKMNYYRNRAYLASKYGKGINKHKFFLKGMLYFLCKLNFRDFYFFIRYYIDGFKGSYSLPSIR